MIDLLRRHVAILASLAIGWSGYSYWDGGSAKAEAAAKGRNGGIEPSYLAQRDPAVPLVISGDPYRLAVDASAAGHAPSGGSGGDSGGSADAANAAVETAEQRAATLRAQAELVQAVTGALREGARSLFASRDVPAASDAAVIVEPAPPPPPPPPAGFSMWLQSTLELATGAQARINGRTVAEGETMPFLDPLDPPLLARVQGTTVIVRYAGQDYTADLLASPLLAVGERGAAETATPPSATNPAKSTKPATAAPAAPSQPAASPPPAGGAAKPKGTYRVRGKSTGKKKP